MKYVTVLIILIVCCYNAESYKILGIFPWISPSHYILGSALMKGLAERGHDVTMISPFGEKNIPKNWTYRDILLTGFVEEYEKKFNMMNSSAINPLEMVLAFANMSREVIEKTIAHTNVQKLLHSKNEHFDVVIYEQVMSDAFKGFGYHFKAPIIVFSTIGANAMVNYEVGNPSNPSYVPNIFFGFPENMTFGQRAINFLATAGQLLLQHIVQFPMQNEIMQKYFSGAPDVREIETSLVLLNSHISLTSAEPKMPNMIDIGGFHVQPPKRLPKHLQDYLDQSTNGAIYFSLGSYAKSKDMPEEKKNAFIRVFAKLKLNIVWKFEEESLPGKSPNVKIEKWLPQQDVLAHPNVKLFITHGGLLSTTETIYHGVPILAIPIMGDQTANARMAEKNGFGLILPYQEVTEEKLTEKINALLTNPQYRENAKTRCKILHDNQNKPMDTATYWVEYVIRHRGAPHLKSSALNLTWYEYFLLDVIFVLFLAFVICIITLYVLIKFTIKFLRKPKRKSKNE